MSRDVQHVVDATHDAIVAILVGAGTVACKVILALEVLGVIALLEALRVAPDGAHHRRSWALDYEDAAFAAPDRVTRLIDDVGEDSWQGKRARAGLERVNPRERRNHVAARLGLPPGIEHRATTTAHDVVVPHPSFGVNRLAHRAENAKPGEIVFLRLVAPRLDERADRGGRGVEHRHRVILDHFPKASGVRIGGYALEDHLGRTHRERPGDPEV